MSTVQNFAKHLLYLKPDQNAARLALYHYLINHCQSSQVVDAELIKNFITRALSFEHWQNHRKELDQELRQSLEHFLTTHQIQLDLSEILFPQDYQVVRIENSKAMEEIIQSSLSGQNKHQVFQDKDGLFVVISLMGDETLKVRCFNSLAYIRRNRLLPLTTDLVLNYDNNLQLRPESPQHLQINPFLTARFSMGPKGCTGRLIRGYTFQKAGLFDGGGLNRYPTLFYPVKRLEQFFINRKSDPMYIELVQILEKAVELIRNQHPEAYKFAKAAYERGRLALEQIFPDDNLVRLLIHSLEIALKNQGQLEKTPLINESSDQWLNQAQKNYKTLQDGRA